MSDPLADLPGILAVKRAELEVLQMEVGRLEAAVAAIERYDRFVARDKEEMSPQLRAALAAPTPALPPNCKPAIVPFAPPAPPADPAAVDKIEPEAPKAKEPRNGPPPKPAPATETNGALHPPVLPAGVPSLGRDARPGVRDVEAKIVGALIRGTKGMKTICHDLDGFASADQVRAAVKRLVKAGTLEQMGTSKVNTRYRLMPESRVPSAAAVKREAAVSRSRTKTDAGVQRVVEIERIVVCVESEARTRQEVAEAVALGREVVDAHVDRLVSMNRLREDAEGRLHRVLRPGTTHHTPMRPVAR